MTRSWKTVSLRALGHNVRLLRGTVGSRVGLCLVLKSNAYGHGLRQVLGCHEVLEAASIGLADLEECLCLRVRGPTVRCLLPLGDCAVETERELLDECLLRRIVLTVTSQRFLECLARRAVRLGIVAPIDVMLETGLHRGGADLASGRILLDAARHTRGLRLVGVSTHFATADAADIAGARLQLERFRAVAHERIGVTRHAAGTAATVRLPESRLEMARPGIGLYGIAPEGTRLRNVLLPALRWETRIIGIQRVVAGDAVGYGGRWTAGRTTFVGLLPVGYADGVRRSLANRGSVIVRGGPAPIVGAISMNLTAIDLGPRPAVERGERVVLLDDDPGSPASVYRWAELMETTPYEVLVSIGPRAPVTVRAADEGDREHEILSSCAR